MVKIRHQNQVQNRAIYLALALKLQGHKSAQDAPLFSESVMSAGGFSLQGIPRRPCLSVFGDALCLRQFSQPHVERIPIRLRQSFQLRNRQPFVCAQ